MAAGAGSEKFDFFLSRASADGRVARMIASILTKAGRSVLHQDDDAFRHSSFMRMMEQGYDQQRSIALLSPAYQASEHCRKEYNTVLAHDPSNLAKRLIVFRIAPCLPAGNLRDIGYIDLVPLLEPLDVERLAHVVRVAIGVDRPREDAQLDRLVTLPAQILHPEIKAFPGFVGRQDLMERLDETLWPGGDASAGGSAAGGRAMLRNSNSGLAAGVMTGLGGVGKSTLATEWAWRNRARYHGVWWLRAEREDTILDDLIDLGARLVPGLREVPDRRAAAMKTLEVIGANREARPWLLVYDNAEGAEVMDWTPHGGAHVLLTSRTPDWWGHAAEIDVGVWPRETAVEFLLAQARGVAESPEAVRVAAAALADELGCHPLALAIARAHAWGMNCGLAEYHAHYRAQADLLIARDPSEKGRAVDYPRSIAATFTMGLERAAATAPQAERLLGICAFLDPDAIPLDLVTDDVMPPLEKGEAVAALAEAALVTSETLADGTPAISMHRLVQTVMRARLASPSPLFSRGEGGSEGQPVALSSPAAAPHPDPLPASGEREAFAALATRLVAAAFPSGERDPSDVRTWPACQRLAPHARAVLVHASDSGEAASQTSHLASQLAIYLLGRAEHAEAEPLMRRALNVDEASHGPDHPNVASLLNNLAQLLKATNRLAEAEPLMRRAMAIDEASYGPDHPIVAIRLNNLATLLQATNRLGEAEPLMRRALAIDEASYGPVHPSVAIDLNNLARLLQATGRLGEAEPLMSRALAIFMESLGSDHPSTLRVSNNLAALEAAIAAQKGGGPGEPSPGRVQGGSPAAQRSGDLAPRDQAAKAPWWRRLIGG